MSKFQLLATLPSKAFVKMNTEKKLYIDGLKFQELKALEEEATQVDGYSKNIHVYPTYSSNDEFCFFSSFLNDEEILIINKNGETWHIDANNSRKFIKESIGSLEEKAAKAAEMFERAITEASEYDETSPAIMLEKRPDLCEQMLNVECPLIEDNYYVGQGVILRTMDDLRCALDSGFETYDGAERNSIIAEFQKVDCSSYEERFQKALSLAL